MFLYKPCIFVLPQEQQRPVARGNDRAGLFKLAQSLAGGMLGANSTVSKKAQKNKIIK